MISMAFRTGICIAATVLVCAGLARASGDPPNYDALDLQQLMEIEIVVGASKRVQETREVPSFVTIVTAAEIKSHGYRTLADVLQTQPSFYSSTDRNYSFAGVRGFERPGDFNTRTLFLVNGLRTNDNIYDAAGIGEEFPIDLDLVERIEVIRGPSAALYGSNAFFAVVNVVTRRGASLEGVEVAASAASYGTFGGRASYGRGFSSGLDVLLSVSLSDSSGQSLSFPEFDDPETNHGISLAAADAESFRRLLATVSKGNFTFQAIGGSREKHVPTGLYGSVFNDPRTQTVDTGAYGSLTYDRSFASDSTISARIHGGYYVYEGAIAFVPGIAASRNQAHGEWWGLDVDGGRRLGRHFLTVGTEFRDNYRQDQRSFDVEPFFLYVDAQNGSRRWGAFAQDEIKLTTPLTLYAGVRYDRYESFGSMTSPRVGLVYRPDSATTVKLLAGRAFRAPNEFELHYEDLLYATNPDLGPERIQTVELVVQKLIGGGVQLTASAFHNDLSALVNHVVRDDQRLMFINADEIESKGLELGVQVNRGHGATGRLTYSLQDTVDRATGEGLTNSPRHMAKLHVDAPVGGRFSAALDARFVSSRRTLAGQETGAYALANLSLHTPRLFQRIDVSATVYNLFDVAYGAPGHQGLRQDILQQDGRSFRVKTTLRF
jgi:outer membrane receptor for ferrienterochelin and colicin